MRKTAIKLTKANVGGVRFWCVTFSKPGTGGNRRFFKDKQEAETFLQHKKIEKENHGTAAMSLSDKARAEYLHCLELLKPYGATVRDAVTFYLPHVKARHSSCKLAELVER